ncbi:hypothetical protein D9757_006468 [Collybiopsis confluens]|uniref:NADP-dependent oxidoreductase domain-containing protein n=1 Tax=Collybiopsis confluens TaxID=2823264 RepID=A0A8H5HJK1_9AGAR|nr:hypothetical protein D9757_006468 [Collybiopsis confluens]
MPTGIPTFQLNDGTKMPAIGMGCWMGVPISESDERVHEMCVNAIKAGYRHFDTAARYAQVLRLGSESQIGRAVRNSGLPRNEFYITTKLANPFHSRVKEAFEGSLETLDCEYIDLYLIHWPQAGKPECGEDAWGDAVFRPNESPTFIETWKDMEQLLQDGRVKSIGLSNFSIKNLEILLPHCTTFPVTNQVELHPFLPQHELKTYCDSKGILLTAYSPLGQPAGPDQPTSLFNNSTITSLANKLHVDVAQVLLSWGVQRRTAVIPKTVNPARMERNISLIHLSPEEMKSLDDLHLQPNMHKSLFQSSVVVNRKLLGWTLDELGFPEHPYA